MSKKKRQREENFNSLSGNRLKEYYSSNNKDQIYELRNLPKFVIFQYQLIKSKWK